MRIRARGAAAIAVILLTVAACSKPAEPVKIVSIDLSNAVDANNHVVGLSETFEQKGTVYAAISTEGSGTAELKARWLDPQGTLVTEQTQKINPTKPSTFEFHYVPPSGWAKGRQKVEFTIDGTGGRTREFEVR
jgi:hypothetical protein